MKFSVRASYPESGKYNWLEAVKIYEDIGFIEVAFLDPELFLGAKVRDIIMPFKKTNIEVLSIKQHYPVYYSEEKVAMDFDKILSFLGKIKFKGHLVLEYLPQFHPQLLPDGLKLKSLYEE